VTDGFATLEATLRAHLPRHLPDGVVVTEARLGERDLNVEARKSFFSISLTARVVRSPDSIRLDFFSLRGAFGLGGDALRDRIALLDEAWPPYHARGVDLGDALVITLR
jgi:hypothetical protein